MGRDPLKMQCSWFPSLFTQSFRNEQNMSWSVAVLFDALQIPAGMHPFCQIPLDSSRMELESSGMGLDSTAF